MPTLGVNVAIINEHGQILLIQREDFEVWCLPGGQVDDGESLAEAAVREAGEETGLQVELTRLVGSYSRPRWLDGSSHVVLFAARPVGGTLVRTSSETIDAAYFDPSALPSPLMFGFSRRIRDAVSGAEGVSWKQSVDWPFDAHLSRRELYEKRDQSGLSRQEFYLKYLNLPVIEEAEVGRQARSSRDKLGSPSN